MEEKMLFEATVQQQSPALAMAYIPIQKWQNIYSSDVGFHRGTIFAELDKPFIGEEAVPHRE